MVRLYAFFSTFHCPEQVGKTPTSRLTDVGQYSELSILTRGKKNKKLRLVVLYEAVKRIIRD